MLIKIRNNHKLLRKRKHIMKNNYTYIELHEEVEDLYQKEEYLEILTLVKDNSCIDILDVDGQYFFEFIETLSICNIENRNYNQALKLIDLFLCLNNLSELYNGYWMEYVTALFELKLMIFEKQNKLIKQLIVCNKYFALGGCDDDILQHHQKVNDALFLKYVKVNKVIAYITLCIILTSIVSQYSIGKSVFLIFTKISALWFILNYYLHRRIKVIYIRIINSIFK